MPAERLHRSQQREIATRQTRRSAGTRLTSPSRTGDYSGAFRRLNLRNIDHHHESREEASHMAATFLDAKNREASQT